MIYLLQHLLESAAAARPDATAAVCGDRAMTYGELDRRSSQLAAALARQGVERGDRVGLLFKRSLESLAALFGVLKAGAAYVPLDPSAPAERHRFIIDRCGIRVLLAAAEGAARLLSGPERPPSLAALMVPGDPGRVAEAAAGLRVVSWADVYADEPDGARDPGIADTSPAYILFTSGSTGTPKGVVISHLNALTFVNSAGHAFGIRANDVLSGHASLHFDLSVFDIYTAFRAGAAVALIPEFLSAFPLRLAEYIEEKGISVWNSVPSALALLSERGRLERFAFDAVRLVLFAGEVMPAKYLARLTAQFRRARFFNVYGQTEANSSLAYAVDHIPGDEQWKVPIGKPLPNFEVFALDGRGRPIAPGEEGELYVRASTVALGYWGDEERTRRSFAPDPRHPFSSARVYRTGDLVRLDEAGNYVFAGRRDHMVKSRGHRIELDEIELSLYSFPGVRQAAVVAIPDDLVGNRLIGYVAGDGDRTVRPDDLLRHCGRRLPPYMVPETIEIRDRLPATSTGKIDKISLAEDAAGKFAGRPPVV